MTEINLLLANITRCGQNTQIDANDLVVGDVITVSYGSKVPADALIIDGEQLAFDESALTGEPDNIPKAAINASNFDNLTTTDPFIRAGSLCMSGQCRALVIAVGKNTMVGETLAGLEPVEPMEQE